MGTHPQGCCCCDQHLGVECEEDGDEAKQSLADDEGISSSDDDDEGSSGRSRRYHVTKGRQVNGRDARRGDEGRSVLMLVISGAI